MTCIIGVVCKDGIVLVGDKKVTQEAGGGGDMASYQDKIIRVENYKNLVIAAAGTVNLRDKFINDLNNSDGLLKRRIIKEDPSRKFVGLVEDIAARLYKIYGPRLGKYYSFEALVCGKPDSGRPWLFSIDQSGCASEISKKQVYCIIGSGYNYGHLFIKPVFPQYGDMEGVAIVSAFVIHLIDEMDIDSSIGPDEKGNVQVWFFPNDAAPYEVKGQALKKIVDEAKKRLSSFADFLILGKTRN